MSILFWEPALNTFFFQFSPQTSPADWFFSLSPKQYCLLVPAHVSSWLKDFTVKEFWYWSEFCRTCYRPFVCGFVFQDVGTACSGLSVFITWKESLAGDRGAMGLSVLQKWMVEGRGLGVNRTGVWKDKWTETSKSVWQERTFQGKTIDKWFNFLCGRPNQIQFCLHQQVRVSNSEIRLYSFLWKECRLFLSAALQMQMTHLKTENVKKKKKKKKL